MKADKFTKDTKGQVAVISALMALPLAMAATLAVDSSRAKSEQVVLQGALDSAALAAITNQVLTPNERAIYAQTYFSSNYSDNDRLEFRVIQSGKDRVALSAKLVIPTTLPFTSKFKDITVYEKSESVITYGDVVCVLVLDPSGERAFEVTGGAQLHAKTCSVQVNSKNRNAAIIDHGGVASAKDFCVTGGAVGEYEPYVNTECGAITDPYKEKRPPMPGECLDEATLKDKLSSWQAESHGITLQPGTYCGGLHLRAKVVKFSPGTYIIKDGPLFFDYGTKAVAEDVTFVLAGEDAYLKINEGSDLSITAPKTGNLAGLAFFQDTRFMGSKSILPNYNTIVRSGGNLKIVGTAYLPTHKISFKGGSLLAAQAPATSFIGYNVSVGDGAYIEVDVDHESAGLPPVLPRSDESARLIK